MTGIVIMREGDEYVALAPDCLLSGFGSTEEEARADLMADAAECYDRFIDDLRRERLSKHLAATIPHIARLLQLPTTP